MSKRLFLLVHHRADETPGENPDECEFVIDQPVVVGDTTCLALAIPHEVNPAANPQAPVVKIDNYESTVIFFHFGQHRLTAKNLANKCAIELGRHLPNVVKSDTSFTADGFTAASATNHPLVEIYAYSLNDLKSSDLATRSYSEAVAACYEELDFASDLLPGQLQAAIDAAKVLLIQHRGFGPSYVAAVLVQGCLLFSDDEIGALHDYLNEALAILGADAKSVSALMKLKAEPGLAAAKTRRALIESFLGRVTSDTEDGAPYA